MKHKFKLLKQDDSVYADHGVNITLDNWNDWETFCIKTRQEKKELEIDIETRWDLGECRECGIISIEHLTNYFKWITRK